MRGATRTKLSWTVVHQLHSAVYTVKPRVQQVTWFGIVQRTLGIPFHSLQVPRFEVVLTGIVFAPSIVQDLDCRGIKPIQCTGKDVDDFQLDTKAFVAAKNIEQQVFFAQLPCDTAPSQAKES